MKIPRNFDIKAVVFDFGGVIQFWGNGNLNEEIAKSIGISKVDFNNQYFKLNHLSNVENLPWEEMILKVVEHFTHSPESKARVLELVKNIYSQKEINYELLSFFPIIKEKGYKIAILSNASSALRSELKRLKIDVLVDEVVVSGEIGFQKPHKEAFDVLFDKLGVVPNEVVFIDDAKKSLEKAEEIGYIPILFRGNDQLKVDLRNLGISL